MRNFVASAMQRHSSNRGGNAAMAYDAALREALTILARTPNDPVRVRNSLANRSLWAADPLHPGEGDAAACPDFMWSHLRNITYDNCIKALGTKHSNIADTVPEGDGLMLLDQMYNQAEPDGLGAVEDIEKEMDACQYQDGADITDHLTQLQALIKKYDRASNVAMSGEKKKRFLLKTLPNSWQTPVQNWEAGPLTFEELLPQVKEFTSSVSYMKMKEHGHAMIGGVLECFNCGGNHRIKDCPDLPVKQIPSAKGRQARYRDRGRGKPQRKTDRLSKKDASALVSMLHMISSSWISDDEDPEIERDANLESTRDINLEIATDQVHTDQSINGTLSEDAVSLISQSAVSADMGTKMDKSTDRDQDRDRQDQDIPTTMSDFDRDFKALFGKRKMYQEPELHSEWLDPENIDLGCVLRENETFDIWSGMANQTGKSSFQHQQNHLMDSKAQNRHWGGLYAKNAIFDQSTIVDSQTQKSDFEAVNSSFQHSAHESGSSSLDAMSTAAVQLSLISVVWCMLIPLASVYSAPVFIMQCGIAMFTVKIVLNHLWDKMVQSTRISTFFRTGIFPVMCQPKLIILWLLVFLLSAVTYFVQIPQAEAYSDHTALAGDINCSAQPNSFAKSKMMADPIQWEQKLLSPAGDTFTVDFAVDSGCSTNTINRHDVFLSMEYI